MRKHLLILLLLTLLIRGVMFISYPLGGQDDNQAGQNFLINELVSGNFLIGNLRFNTGYPLVIAPVAAFAQFFGRFDDRIILLVQLILSSTIPFLMYDILRVRRSPSEAFFVALVVMLNPFGWQWAHFTLPEWLVAFCVVLGLWLIHRGLLSSGRLLGWVAGAGLVFGVAVLARINFAPVLAVPALMCFALRQLSLRKRLAMCLTISLTSAGVLLGYMLAIHVPSTGVWTISCIGAQNLVLSLAEKGVPVIPENGPATARYYELVMLEPRDLPLLADTYPLWRIPGPWVPPEEQAQFLGQTPPALPDTLPTVFPGTLFRFLGPCPTDQLLREVFAESVRLHLPQWISGIVTTTGQMILYQPAHGMRNLYLPHYAELTFTGGRLAGFQTSDGAYYNGQVVWVPGIWLYSLIFNSLPVFAWLTPFAALWAFLSRSWFYRVFNGMILAFFVLVAALAHAEPRYYATVYPLTSAIVGGFLFALFRWLRGSFSLNAGG